MKHTARSNIVRVLGHVGLLSSVVIDEERYDRVIGTARGDLEAELIRRQWTEDPTIDPVHFDGHARASYREPDAVMPSLQIVFEQGSSRVDVDLDFANPFGGDVASGVVHIAEWAWHLITRTKTNPDRMAAAVDRRFGKETA